MTPCIIESPYAGDIEANTAYLQECIRWCIEHGFTPYASHQMLTSALSEETEREIGLRAGIAMSHALASIGAPWLFFVDRHVSRGMREAAVHAERAGRPIYMVSIYRDSPRLGPWRINGVMASAHWFGSVKEWRGVVPEGWQP